MSGDKSRKKWCCPGLPIVSPKRWKKPPFVESSDNTDIKTFHVPISSFPEWGQKLICSFMQFSKAL